VISKEVVKPDAGRVTAGLPLDSSQRFQHDAELVSRDFVHKLDAEHKRTVKLATEKDGDRPINDKDACRGITLLPDTFISKLSRLNRKLRFMRSETIPSQMMCCVSVPISVDHPKGLRYIGGFAADRPISEMGYFCTTTRMMRAREGFLEEVTEPCKGCIDCMFLGQLPGWRTLIERLVQNLVISRGQAERAFGTPSIDSRNLQRSRNGS
jgi:hypothetical protein